MIILIFSQWTGPKSIGRSVIKADLSQKNNFIGLVPEE